jgi:ceramide glucosyltransferase
MTLLAHIPDVFMAAALAACLWTSVECVLVRRFAGERNDLADPGPAVTVLKPLHGDEPGLFERLAALCRQDYSGTVQIVLGTEKAVDLVARIAQRLRSTFQSVAIDVDGGAGEPGRNRKIANLAGMMRRARHPIIVMSDSDIAVGPRYLREVVGLLGRPGVGGVTCLYHGIAAGGLGSEISALAINTRFLPQAVAAVRLGLARPCFGATIALRRETLDQIGGFRRFADILADDHAIGRAIRAAGYDIAIPGFTVGHVCFEQDLREHVRHELRVARTIKQIDRLGYAGTIFTHPLPLALLAAFPGRVSGVALVVLAFACRAALCRVVERRFDLPRQPLWLLPLHDLVAFGIYAASFFGSTVSWRGTQYRLSRSGNLVGGRR